MPVVEQFAATAICPKCGACDVHPFRLPRYAPTGDDEIARNWRRIAELVDYSRALSGQPPYYDPDDADVMRQCNQCDWEWPQR